MKKQEYLNSILRRRAIIPRYCVETIDYLSIKNGTRLFNEVAILQKCFCDIPFHKLAASFAVNGVGDVYESLSKDERADLEKNNTQNSLSKQKADDVSCVHLLDPRQNGIYFPKSRSKCPNYLPQHLL